MDKWTTTKSESLVDNHWVKIRKDSVVLPNEQQIDDFYVITINNAAAIVAIDEDGNCILKKEYRYCYDRDLIEVPAGTFEEDETDGLAVAKRELLEEEAVVICPVDPYVEDDYFKTIEALGNRAAESEANLVLMGIEPTYPSEKYGYIIPKSKENISEVSMFKEKPTAEVAEGYISQGALWNGGVFAFRLGYVLKRAHELIDFKNYDDLFAKYNTLKKISFDYAVVEHEPLIEVMRFSGTWKDLGTWNTLTEAMDSNNVGEALFNEKCENVHVVNELNMPVLCMGLKDVVVSASPEGILVSDKEQSSYIKPFVETFNKQVMFAEKSWGSFRVLDVEKESLTIKVTLNPGHKMNYHSHTNRDEVWTVVSGTGYTIIDGQKQIVRPGDVLRMPAGCKHTIVADTELQVIEVQMGKDISVHDKEKFELEL